MPPVPPRFPATPPGLAAGPEPAPVAAAGDWGSVYTIGLPRPDDLPAPRRAANALLARPAASPPLLGSRNTAGELSIGRVQFHELLIQWTVPVRQPNRFGLWAARALTALSPTSWHRTIF